MPEAVLMASGMEVASAVAFLYENYTDFVHEEAIGDACSVADYFSQAGICLLVIDCAFSILVPRHSQVLHGHCLMLAFQCLLRSRCECSECIQRIRSKVVKFMDCISPESRISPPIFF